jgi:hypothetical protein
MSYSVWVVAFYVLGTLYLLDWFWAQGKCKPNDKWLMFTPFWPFAAKSFDPDAKGSLKRAKIYMILVVVLIVARSGGIVSG